VRTLGAVHMRGDFGALESGLPLSLHFDTYRCNLGRLKKGSVVLAHGGVAVGKGHDCTCLKLQHVCLSGWLRLSECT
jgi:hypothetical protein